MATIQLTVNDVFVSRILTCFRANFPTITQGLADGPAAKAVIIELVRQQVAAFEAEQAVAPIGAQIQTQSANWQNTFATQRAQTQTDVGVNVT